MVSGIAAIETVVAEAVVAEAVVAGSAAKFG
jgi:hypothetical protein